MKKINILIALCLLAFAGCRILDQDPPDREGQNQVVKCDTRGEVVDFTGLDGCGLLIVKEDGSKLMPVEVVPAFQLKAGQKIEFAYESKPMANACMAGETVKITCIRELAKAGNCSGNLTPVEVASTQKFASIENGDFVVSDASVSGSKLTLTISFSGCDPDRNFRLYASEAKSKSLPPQRAVKLTFESQVCDAWFTRDVCFDMDPLGEETVILIQGRNKTHSVKVNTR